MRRFRSLFKLSFVMLVIFLLIFKLKNSDVRAEDTSGLNVEIYNNNSWVENNKYMYHYDMVITNEGDEEVNGWEISIQIPGENIQVTSEWNINCAVNGDRIVITPEGEYFKHISSGKSVNDMGLIISSDTEIVDGKVGSTLVTQDKTETPTEPVTEPPTEPVTEPTTEAPTEPVTELTTEAPTEPVTEPTTEAPTEPVTEPTTEASTEPVTEPTTEVPTEPVTEPTTEAPTEPATEPTTETPTEDKPEGAVEIRRNGKYYLHIGTTYYLAPGQWMCSREDNECIAQGGNVFYIRVDGTYEFTRIEE